ncbi:hypothetical protein A3I58_00775 [Candidatus Peregrinibacteria bacterium RIFCSPLOWO2_02_FULL_39_10]|nr:MAG: hypothetical protein A3I58_00775 [Candidatus Peregrinibacteria bacterium RIFCSPLOWO2_02_FULL_39_10]
MDETEKKLWKKVNRYAWFLKFVPFLRMAAVCNNLAFGKVGSGSDIDLFIIADNGRLFTVRTFVTFLFHVFGARRHGNKIAGRFCLSFFVDDSALNLKNIAIDKDIYLAFWIKSILPLIDDGVSREFISANDWARRYFEKNRDFKIDRSKVVYEKSFITPLFEILLDGVFGNFIEDKLRKWQQKRAHGKMEIAGEQSSLLVNDHVLKFHNIDRRTEYKNKWIKTYGNDAKLTGERFFKIV